MFQSVTVRGVEGALRWGYQPAGTLGAWTVTRDGSAWTLSASIVKTDAFRVSQRPLAFEARHAHGVWRWPVQSLQIAGASLNAVLGPPEK
jgi:hypothetical protein